MNLEIPSARGQDVLGLKGNNVRAIREQSRVLMISVLWEGGDKAVVRIVGTTSTVQMSRVRCSCECIADINASINTPCP